MDLTLLKKKISSYRTPSGRITSLPDELLGEILHAWEQWSGPASGFYRALGADYRKMGALMGRAKKLKREGVFDGLEFKEVQIEGQEEAKTQEQALPDGAPAPMILKWGKGKIIRFYQVDHLVEFLNKAA